MKKSTLLFTFLLIVITIPSYFFYKSTNNSKRDQNSLVVGIAAGYAPFISINKQGQYEGLDIDVITQIAKIMNKNLILKDLGSMTSLLMALDQNSIDAIIWGMSITQERLEKNAMVHYQGEQVTSYPLLFWQTIPDTITSLHDMQGYTICVEPSSAQDKVLQKYPDITILPTEKVDDSLLNLQYKKAQAALVDPAIAKKFQSKYPEIKILNIPLDQEDQSQGHGIMIKKTQSQLITEVTKAVQKLKDTSFIAQAEQQWEVA